MITKEISKNRFLEEKNLEENLRTVINNFSEDLVKDILVKISKDKDGSQITTFCIEGNDKELLNRYEQFLRVNRQLSEATITGYSLAVKLLNNFLNKTSKIKSLRNITQEGIQSFLVYLKDKTNMQGKQGLGPASISVYIAGLRSFYHWLTFVTKDTHVTEISFFLDHIIKTKKIYIKDIVLPQPIEIERLRETIHKHLSCTAISNYYRIQALEANAIFELLITTGLRARELMGLRLKDINLEKKVAVITNAKGGRNRDRISIFGESAKIALKEWIETKKLRPEDYLFQRKANRDLNYMIKLWAKKAGINPKLHAHSFRHYYITEAQKQNIPVEIVAVQVGHRDLNQTRHYTHFDPEFLSRKMEGLKI